MQSLPSAFSFIFPPFFSLFTFKFITFVTLIEKTKNSESCQQSMYSLPEV